MCMNFLLVERKKTNEFFISGEEKKNEFLTLLFLCTTMKKLFYKIKFSFLCTPIDVV